MNYAEINQIMTKFTDAKYKVYGSHSYSSGYYETLLSSILCKLPEAERDAIIKQIVENT